MVGAQGPILSSFGTTGVMELGDRGQYTHAGYAYSLMTAGAFSMAVPFLTHLAGACLRPPSRASEGAANGSKEANGHANGHANGNGNGNGLSEAGERPSLGRMLCCPQPKPLRNYALLREPQPSNNVPLV